jgi:SSS family solute:Na+ symporter
LLISDADQLFPRYIMLALPMGITGLVIAGLLSASMSSLSSGINSSCSVITVDFIERLGKRGSGQPGPGHVRTAKYVAVLVGLVVVVLSAYVGVVEGNLLEVSYKVVNVFTAPLFGLFFMALFVRRATGLGTLVGAGVGLSVAVGISFWQELTGSPGISFVWALPTSFAAQTAVGVLLSLLGIGRRYASSQGVQT